jgi:hypothetical protein
MTLSDRRHHMYSRDKLIPKELIEEINYKKTYEALKEYNEEELKKLMFTTAVREQLKHFYMSDFDLLINNKEKKFAIRAYIYLDCLVAFYRLPTHIEQSIEELTTKFSG